MQSVDGASPIFEAQGFRRLGTSAISIENTSEPGENKFANTLRPFHHRRDFTGQRCDIATPPPPRGGGKNVTRHDYVHSVRLTR